MFEYVKNHALKISFIFVLIVVIVPIIFWAIMHFAFKSCRSIRTVRLPASVRKISINAFYECAALKCVYLPDNFEVMEKCTDNANIRCEFIHKGRQYSYEEAIVKFKE